jgi:chromosome partitioning protein
VIVVSAALKGGVGKTTTSVYLAALAAAGRRSVTLVDADTQASAAEWVEAAPDERLDRLDSDGVAVVDTPPGHERLLGKALERATVVVIPTRVGGVETPRAAAVLEMVPDGTPFGLVICSARVVTRDYHATLADWADAGVRVWGTVPERVAIATGPAGQLSLDGLDAYRNVWRRALRAGHDGRQRRGGAT